MFKTVKLTNVLGHSRCMCMEFAKRGVRVNAIAPAALRSRFNMRFGDVFTSEEQLENYYRVAGQVNR